jgi:hypothetical protein
MERQDVAIDLQRPEPTGSGAVWGQDIALDNCTEVERTQEENAVALLVGIGASSNTRNSRNEAEKAVME